MITLDLNRFSIFESNNSMRHFTDSGYVNNYCLSGAQITLPGCNCIIRTYGNMIKPLLKLFQCVVIDHAVEYFFVVG